MSRKLVDLRRPAVNEFAAKEIKALNVAYLLDFVKYEVTEDYEFRLDDFESDSDREKFYNSMDENTRRNDVEIVSVGGTLYVKISPAEPLVCLVNMIVL